jgi:hypothetical protein
MISCSSSLNNQNLIFFIPYNGTGNVNHTID